MEYINRISNLENHVSSLLFSPDGKTLFYGDDAGHLVVCDIPSLKVIDEVLLPQERTSSRVCASIGSSSAIAAFGYLNKVYVYKYPKLEFISVFLPGNGVVTSVALLADENKLVCSTMQMEDNLFVIDIVTGTVCRQLVNSKRKGPVRQIQLTHDENRLFSLQGSVVTMWDWRNGILLKEYVTPAGIHSSKIDYFTIHSESYQLAVGGYFGELFVLKYK